MSIRFQGVTFTYPEADRPAVCDLQLSIQSNAVTLVTGPLGAGASTLVLLAAGLAPRHTGGDRKGVVETLGCDPGSEDGARTVAGRIATVLPVLETQLSGLAYTVADEVAFGPANLGWPRDRIQKSVDAAMDQMGIAHLGARDPSTLSGGELQRVILGGCIAMSPQVLLLDEPAHELDPAGAEALYAMLPELARDTTVVVATVDVDGEGAIADNVIVLDEGRVVAQGSPTEVFAGVEAASRDAVPMLPSLFYRAGYTSPLPLRIEEAKDWIRR